MPFDPVPAPLPARRNPPLRYAWFVLAAAGTMLPLVQLVPWLAAHGLALPVLMQQAFGNHVAAFAWCDVLVSGCVLLVFMWFRPAASRCPRHNGRSQDCCWSASPWHCRGFYICANHT